MSYKRQLNEEYDNKQKQFNNLKAKLKIRHTFTYMYDFIMHM